MWSPQKVTSRAYSACVSDRLRCSVHDVLKQLHLRSMGEQRNSLLAFLLKCFVVTAIYPTEALVALDGGLSSLPLASPHSRRSLRTHSSSPHTGFREESAGEPQKQRQAAQSASPELATAITIVKSANDLVLALDTGARHIDLRSHINLSGWSINNPVNSSEPLLPDVMSTTTSITVRTPSEPFTVCI